MTEENKQTEPTKIETDESAVPANIVRLEGPPEAQQKLVQALAAASLEFKPIFKDATGQFERRTIRYAPLRSLVDATKPALAAQGVVCMQFLTGPTDANLYRLHAWVMGHGAILKSAIDFRQAGRERQGDGERYTDLSGSDVVKAWGARGTYLRRYQYQALFQLDGDEDLDQQSRGDDPEPPAKDASRAPRAASNGGAARTAPKAAAPPNEAQQAKPAQATGRVESRPAPAAGGDDPNANLKKSIIELGKVVGLSDLEKLKSYAEKELNNPWEEIKDKQVALLALQHCLTIEADKRAEAAKNQPDERAGLLEDCHRLGAALGMRTRDGGKVIDAELGKYAFKKFDAVLDDMKRDPLLLRQLRDSLAADVEKAQATA